MPDPAAGGRRRVYWDADCCLNYINGVADRLPDLDACLEAARKGDVLLMTSTLTIAEVAFAETEKARRALDMNIEQKIAGLWQPPVTLVEFHQLIAVRAVALMRAAMTRSESLKPNDAIHLATAQHMGVGEFNTYDRKLLKYAPEVSFTIGPPMNYQRRLLE
jgi:predicted nucleic acid-binding protein